jgi:VIT family protein
MTEPESHYVNRSGWLRAAVLGANDGIISTASLIMGVAAAGATRGEILTAAVAGWAAGAMSMAAGEYVSVSSQADSESADLAREQRALSERPAEEKQELARLYEDRGVKPGLARRVAGQLMAKCARRPCARRTRPERRRSAQADPGRLRVGSGVLGRRGGADARRVSRRAGRGREGRSRRGAGFPRRARRLGGRGALGQAGAESGLLGRAGHGGNRGDRRPDRQGGLSAKSPSRRCSAR